MTPLKQLEVLVTGSDLSNQFHIIRIKLTFAFFAILSTLLIFMGFTTFQLTRIDFENIRPPEAPELISRQEIREKIFDYNRAIRIQNLEKLQNAIFLNYSLLVLLLTLLAWISLYYFLKPISETYKEKEEFLKHATHELRTPLAILKSDLQLSLQEKDIADIKNTNRSALEEIDRLHALASGFLNELSGEKVATTSSKIELKELIGEVWQSLEAINTNNIKLDIKGSKYPITTNKDQLFHTVFNILDNAVKYAKADSTLRAKINFEDKVIVFTNQTETSEYTEGVGLEIIRKNIADLGGKITTKLENNIFIIEIVGL